MDNSQIGGMTRSGDQRVGYKEVVMEIFYLIINVLGGTGMALLIAGSLGRKWISHELKKSQILYEKELAAKTEVLKSDLSIFAHEQMIGISRIDAQRAEAVKSVYSAISKWWYAVNEINYPKSTNLALYKKTNDYFAKSLAKVESANEMAFEVLIENGIYFSSATYNQIADVLRLSTIYSIEVKKIIDKIIETDDEKMLAQVNQELLEEKIRFDAAFDPVRGNLVDEFRRLMRAQ